MYYVHLQKLCCKEDCASSVTSMQVRSLCHKNTVFGGIIKCLARMGEETPHHHQCLHLNLFAEYVSILVNIEALNDIFSCWDLLISYWTIQEPHACKSE
jgi:hypothetical protein